MAQTGHDCGVAVTVRGCDIGATGKRAIPARRVDLSSTMRQADCAMPRSSPLIHWLLLAFLVVAWGSAFAMIKIAVTHLDASWVMALRLTVAAIVLVPYAVLSGQSLASTPASWAKFAWLGFIGHAAPFFLIGWGTHFVSSGVSGLLMGAIPLFVIVLAHYFLPGERLTLPKTIGFLLGFIGIIVLIGPDKLLRLETSGEALIGELAIVLGCVCYATHAITAKRLGFEHPVKQTALVCLTGAAMGLAFALVLNPSGLSGKPLAAFLAVAGLGILPTALASLVMYRLLNRIGPSFVAYSNYLVPPYAVMLGAFFLNEALDWRIAAALALILGGIALSRLQPKPESAA